MSYALHRAIGNSSAVEARRQAAVDTVLVAIGGTSLLLIVLIVFTIQDCRFGDGC